MAATIGGGAPSAQQKQDLRSAFDLARKPDGSNSVFEYSESGAVRARPMVRKDRVQQAGSIWFTPTALAATADRTVATYTGDAFLSQSEVAASKPQLVTYINAGYRAASWTGLSLAMPSDQLLQALVYVDDYENGAASPLGGGLDISLTSASGTTTWKWSSGAIKPGWNTLQIWNPASAAHNVCFKSGVSYLGDTNMTFGQTITGVSLIANNPAAGSRVIFAGIFRQTKVKPMVCMTFDTSAQNVFTNFVPAWSAKGLSAGLRCGGADSYRSATWTTPLAAAVEQGFDVCNGSWSRATLNTSSTAALVASEVGLQQNYNARFGLARGSCLFSSAGNSLPKASVYRDIMPKFGVTLAKGPTGGGRANFFGPAGLDDPLYLTVQGWGGRTAELARIAGLLETGGLLMWFAHECPSAGAEPPPDSASPGNGGGIYAEDAVYFANYLADLQAQGLIDVVSPSQLDLILRGLA